MPASTLVSEPPLAPDTEPIQPEPAGPAAAADSPSTGVDRSTFRTAWPVTAMACGLVVLAVAATIVVRAGQRAQPTPVIAAAAADPTVITVSARDVSVVTQVYEPGEQSGWHTHPGIHAVAVLSGVLSVYDDQCRLQTFEPGRPYVGGQQLHLVRNEGDVPVTMAVTYLSPSAPGTSTKQLARPDGCGVG